MAEAVLLWCVVPAARNQKEYVNALVGHGEVDISNNFAENAISYLQLGEKLLFRDIPKGVDSSAIVCTPVETAKFGPVCLPAPAVDTTALSPENVQLGESGRFSVMES